MSKGVKVPGINFFGGAGGGTSDIIEILSESELGTLVPRPNQIVDNYQTDKGTKVNLVAQANALRFVGVNLDGTQERVVPTSPDVSDVELAVFGAVQHVAPKNNTGVSGNTLKFDGNVTDIIPVGMKLLLIRMKIAEGNPVYQHARTVTNKVAKFTVSTSEYILGTNETTIIVTQPIGENIDLTMGVLAGNYKSELRAVPYKHKFEVKSKSSSAYEEMEMDQAAIYQPSAVGLAGVGEGSSSTPFTGYTASTQKTDAVMSENKQYGIYRAVEERADGISVHIFYTKDSGNTWTKFSYVGNQSFNSLEENNGAFYAMNRSQIAVANNGKFALVWQRRNGVPLDGVFGAYGDLSVASPSVTELPATGADGSNDLGATPGWVYSHPTLSIYGNLAYDKQDLSYLVIAGRSTNNDVALRAYINGGATLSPNTSNGRTTNTVLTFSQPNSYQGVLALELFGTGTGASRYISMATENASSATIHYWRLTADTFSFSSPTLINALSTSMMDSISAGDRHYIFFIDTTKNNKMGLMRIFNVTTTPIAQTNIRFSDSSDGDGPHRAHTSSDGYSIGGQYNVWKFHRSLMVVDPADDKHLFLVRDFRQPTGISSSVLYEIADTTNMLGEQITQFSQNDWKGMQDAGTQHKFAQTITASNTRIRSIGFRAIISGIFTNFAGKSVICEIQETTGGLPNGTVVATSNNSIAATEIAKNASGQWIYFTFPTTNLVSGTYALVLSISGGSLSGSDVIGVFIQTGGSAYSGGEGLFYNGTIWSNAWNNGVNDFTFQIFGEWCNDIGNHREQQTSLNGHQFWNVESTIALINSSRIQYLTRVAQRDVAAATTAMLQQNGNLRRREISINGTVTKATIGTEQLYGYVPGEIDPNLILTVSCGSDASTRLNSSTGAAVSNPKGEDRSGLSTPVLSYNSLTSSDIVSDSDFQSGFCLNLNNTSGKRISYRNSEAFNFLVGRPFIIEAEIKLNALGPGIHDHVIFATSPDNSQPPTGINFMVQNGFLRLWYDSGGFIQYTTASDHQETLAYKRVRVVYDGTIVRLYRAETAPYTAFVEVGSYSQQAAFVDSIASGGVCIGGLAASNVYVPNMKIGYVKVVNGAAAFTYDGFKSQPALVGASNLGTKATVERKIGENSLTSGLSHDEGMFVKVDDGSLVDSHLQYFIYKHSIQDQVGNEMHVKSTMERGSTRDNAFFNGLAAGFSKAA
jgi:hypothetical protein